MKSKLLCIVAVCIMVLALGGCQKGNKQDKLQERKIFIMEKQGEREGKFIEFEPSYDYGFEGVNYQKIYDDVEEKKNNPHKTGGKLTYEKSECVSNVDDIGTFYSVYDMYRGQCGEEEIEVSYLHNTDIVCWYHIWSKSGSFGEKIEREMTEQELVDTSEKFLKEVIGVDNLVEYTFDGIYDGDDILDVVYVRYVDEYETDELLQVFIDKGTGKVIFYNGYNYKKYDNIGDKVTTDKINAALEELKIKMDELDIEGVTYSKPKVDTDMWGEIYAKIVAIYIDDTGKEIRKVFFVSLGENMIK